MTKPTCKKCLQIYDKQLLKAYKTIDRLEAKIKILKDVVDAAVVVGSVTVFDEKNTKLVKAIENLWKNLDVLANYKGKW